MDKTKKNTDSNNWALRTIFGLILCGVLYYLFPKQLHFSQVSGSFAFHPTFYLSILLVPLNYGLEYQKWKVSLRTQQLEHPSSRAVQSFFAGLITGLLTPNMQGNFLGRIYYFDRKKRIPLIFLTLIGNMAALLVTLLFGIVGYLIFQPFIPFEASSTTIFLIGIIIVSSLIFYYTFDKSKWGKRKWKGFKRIHLLLTKFPNYRHQMLAWSSLRYITFTIQFALLLTACGFTFNLQLLAAVAVIYLLTTLIPSAFLGKLGVRESVSLTVLGGIYNNGSAILTASLLIWIINILVPALVGLFICKRR